MKWVRPTDSDTPGGPSGGLAMGWHRVRIHRHRINCDIRGLRLHGWLELQQGERDGNRRCSGKLHGEGRQLGRKIPRDIGQHWWNGDMMIRILGGQELR